MAIILGAAARKGVVGHRVGHDTSYDADWERAPPSGRNPIHDSVKGFDPDAGFPGLSTWEVE